jgi:hypothetical protein
MKHTMQAKKTLYSCINEIIVFTTYTVFGYVQLYQLELLTYSVWVTKGQNQRRWLHNVYLPIVFVDFGHERFKMIILNIALIL